MSRMNRMVQRLVGVFLLGLVLFNYPVLQVFNHVRLVGGVPVLWLFLFLAWGGLICLMALILERRED